jgi:hypothetical protein
VAKALNRVGPIVARARKEEHMKRKRNALFVLVIVIVGALGFATLVTAPTQAAFNCKIVSCACPACEANEHLQTPPGECCPVCVPN